MTDTPRSASPPSPTASPNTNARQDTAAAELKTSLLEGAHDLGDQAKTLAGDAATQVRNAAETQISTGKNRAAEGLGSVATALRQTGDQLRSQNNTAITNYVMQAADHVESASSYLQDHSLKDTLGDIEQFARREPALFVGGAFLAGLLGGRFLKSSRAQPPAPDFGSQTSAAPARASGASEEDSQRPGRGNSGGRSQGDFGARRSEKPKENRGQSPRDVTGSNGGADAGSAPKVPGGM